MVQFKKGVFWIKKDVLKFEKGVLAYKKDGVAFDSWLH